MAENTREIILDTLLTLERGEEFSNKLIKAVLDKYNYLEARDRAFIKRVTEGTIERQLELDYYLNHFSSVPVRKMKPLIRCLLRMSTYQLIYMDAVPDSAVCNEACKLAAKRKFVNLKGFVNGILRNVSKNKENLPTPDKKNTKGSFSVKYSMPQWLVEFFLREYGEENTAILLNGLLEIHPVSLRFRRDMEEVEQTALLKEMEAMGARLTVNPYLPNIYSVENIESVSGLPGFGSGSFTVQDVSSALAVQVAGIKAGDFVMDICAAPGGKTMLAAETAARVLARDVSEAKTAVIEENIERMQLDNVEVQVFDATDADESMFEKADVVLMDVPCSGLGIMGKKRDIKYNVSPESLESIVTLQRQIVESSWRYVKPGGVLLYSTCTINPAENREMVRWITENLPFEVESPEDMLPAKLVEQLSILQEKLTAVHRSAEAVQEAGRYGIQLLPGFMEADGFFFARLRRKK